MTRLLSPNYKRRVAEKRLLTKRILEPAPHSLSTTFDVDGGRRDRNVSELGKESLLAFQPLSPQIDPEHDQGGPSHGGFKGPGHVTPLGSQGQEVDGPQERQKQEAALERIGNKDSENGDNGEQRGEKRRHQEETKEISSGSPSSSDSDQEQWLNSQHKWADTHGQDGLVEWKETIPP
jgi:hypothetical protein